MTVRVKRPPNARAQRARRHHHHVYVIELHPRVWNHPRFRKANPDHDILKPCVYVGSTGLTPEDRFENHKHDRKGNTFVKQYGVRLMPELFAVYNPMPYRAALEMEVELACALREAGYGVWQG